MRQGSGGGGQGGGMGSGRGMGGGRGQGGGQGGGQGRGQGGGRGQFDVPEAGGNTPVSTGECLCPSCGTTAPHRRGTPCAQMQCPKCGTFMERKL